jgi:hypothetical protein
MRNLEICRNFKRPPKEHEEIEIVGVAYNLKWGTTFCADWQVYASMTNLELIEHYAKHYEKQTQKI